VPGQRRRAHAVGLGQFRQRVFDCEQGGLGAVGALDVAPGAVEDFGNTLVGVGGLEVEEGAEEDMMMLVF
jgi:hypothetical protein